MNSHEIASVEKKQSENFAISKDLAKGGIIGLIGGLSTKTMTIITTIIITRYLGTHDYGLYSLGLSIVTVISIIVAFGFPMGIVKFVPGFFIQKNMGKIKGALLKSAIISMVIGIFFLILALNFGNFIETSIFKKPGLSIAIIALSFSLLFTGGINSISSYAQAIKRIDIQNLILNFIKPLSFLFLVVISIIVNWRLTGIVYSYAFSAFLTFIIALFLFFKIFPHFLQRENKIDYNLKGFSSFSFYTLLTGFTGILMMRIDRIMIGYFSTASAVGIYSASANIAIYLTIFLTPLIGIFAPLASDFHHRKNHEDLNHTFQKTSRWLTIFTLPIFFIYTTFARELLSIFGRDFSSGYLVLIILSCAELINVSTGPVSIVLKMTGLQKLDTYTGVGALTINIVLNLILIPLYGITGAAISTGLSLAMVNILRMFIVKTKLNLFPYNTNLLKPVGFFAIIWLLNSIIRWIYPNLWLNIIITFMLLSTYIVFIFLFNRESDDDYILNLLKNKLLRI
jgi:O-antigen/teichoic acid export membrane protein